MVGDKGSAKVGYSILLCISCNVYIKPGFKIILSTSSSSTGWLGGSVLDYGAGGPGFDPGTTLHELLQFFP